MRPTGIIRRYAIGIRRDEIGTGNVYAYLCAYHTPETGGRYKDDDNDAGIVSVKSSPVTDYERANFGADECDGCRGFCSIGAAPTPAQESR